MRIAVTGAINSAAAKAKIVIWPISLPNAISKLFNVEGIQSCSFYDDYRHSGGVTRTEIIAQHRSPKSRAHFRVDVSMLRPQESPRSISAGLGSSRGTCTNG